MRQFLCTLRFENQCYTLLEKAFLYSMSHLKLCWGFPGGAVVRNPPASAGDMGWSPGLGRSHMPRSN